MSKSTATANIRATASGGLRTGLSAMRNTAPAPVTIIYGGGSSLPCPVAPQHPEPSNVNPTAAKVAALQAALRRSKRAAKAVAKLAAPKAAPVLLRKLPKGRFAGTFGRNLCAKLAAGKAHTVKVVQSKIDINGGPAFNVFLKLEGQSRGKHVITLYRNAQ